MSRSRRKPEPPPKWRELDSGLTEAAENSKVAIVVFCPKGYDGPATFQGDNLRRALKTSKVIPIKVLPPEVPKVPQAATRDQVNALRKQYAEAVKGYSELLKKYGVTCYPTQAYVNPEKEVFHRLYRPTTSQVWQTLIKLDELLQRYKDAKAKAQNK